VVSGFYNGKDLELNVDCAAWKKLHGWNTSMEMPSRVIKEYQQVEIEKRLTFFCNAFCHHLVQ
jgi:hypothetical protein